MNKSNPVITPHYFGIVSPCSTCNNQRPVPDSVNKLPACPRRAAMALQSQLQNAGLTTIQVAPLVLTGNEDIPTTTSTGLVNPVYSNALNTVLVWVATVSDNPQRLDTDGNIVNPGLLDSGFNTNYINCRPYPVTPSDNEASYRAKGAWSEGNQLSIRDVGSQQTIIGPEGPVPILLNGFADKVNFSFSAPRTPVERDYSVAGS